MHGTQAVVGASPTTTNFPRVDGAIPRPRLVKRLTAAGARGVVLSAPGGYGKTTLLAQWADQDSRPAVWLRIRETAADALAVAQAIAGGLVHVGLVVGEVPLPDREDEAEWLPALAPFGDLIKGADTPFLLVIDDAGLVTGEAWESLLEVVFESMPEGSTLALATRRSTPRTLRRMRTTGTILELDPAELAMTAEETSALYRSMGPSIPVPRESMDDDESLAWPAAVYLEARAHLDAGGRARGSVSALAAIDDFLRDDVLGELDEADRTLLTRGSILSELTGPACDAVTGDSGSLARLVALAHDLHLIAPLDQTYQGFVMHQILRDYLRRDFALNDPAGLEQAHDLASRHFEGVGDVDAAIFHARRAGDDARLAELVWAHCGQRLASAQSLVVQRRLEGLEPSRVEASCPLALAQAWASSHQGELDVTQRLLFLAEEHCRQPNVPQDVRDAVELLRVTLGSVAIPEIVTSMRLVTDRLGNDEWATLSQYMLGIGLALSGDLQSARAAFTAGAKLSASLTLPVMEAHCLSGLIDAALTQGEPKSVSVAMARLRELIDTVAIDRVVTAAPVLTTSAQMYLVEGRVPEARAEADRALRLAATMRQVAPWAAVLIRVRLSSLYLAVGAPAMAAQLLEEAKELHGPASEGPVLDHGLQQLSDAMASIGVPAADARGVLTTAEIRVLQYLPTHLTFAGIGEKLFVSRNTIKSQVHSIYGKLHVNSRSEAVEVARRMGLLR